ncbi:MAG: CHAP domain-containing protein [Patescibacteria group bacterium]|nr:CHAP domain-containing protein [bacterium]MDZ4240955.1 CHAP domain-containing protein [Patescibacteria group bacterium]
MRIKALFFILVSVLLGVSTTYSWAEMPSEQLLNALELKESSGGINQRGPVLRTGRPYGHLQIRQPVCDDVNKRHKTNYKPKDTVNNPKLSRKICRLYLDMYATRKRLGRTPTDEDFARIWNGGPNGWKKSDTVSYWTGTEKRKGVKFYLQHFNEMVKVKKEKKHGLELALEYVGFGNVFNKDGLSWCADFVVAIFKGKLPVEPSRSAKILWKNFQEAGLTTKNPSPGDLIFFWRESPRSWKGHTGVIKEVTENHIVTVEGNIKGKVVVRTYKRNHIPRLLGYGKVV